MHLVRAQNPPADLGLVNYPSDSLQRADSVPSIRGVVQFSADTLEDLVVYKARDSIRLDNVTNLIYLYGDASIKYQTFSITADYILVDLDSSIAIAEQVCVLSLKDGSVMALSPTD